MFIQARRTSRHSPRVRPNRPFCIARRLAPIIAAPDPRNRDGSERKDLPLVHGDRNHSPHPRAAATTSDLTLPEIGGHSHFLIRRLHSLTGIVFGGYIVVHLLVNATLVEGAPRQRRGQRLPAPGG